VKWAPCRWKRRCSAGGWRLKRLPENQGPVVVVQEGASFRLVLALHVALLLLLGSFIYARFHVCVMVRSNYCSKFYWFFSAQHEIVVVSYIVQLHSIISTIDDCISVNLSHCGYLKTCSIQRLRFLILHFDDVKNISNCIVAVIVRLQRRTIHKDE